MQDQGLTLDELAQKTGLGYSRWSNVLSGKAKIRLQEIEELGKLFPEYKFWLAYGETLPKAGQIMPKVAEEAAAYESSAKSKNKSKA